MSYVLLFTCQECKIVVFNANDDATLIFQRAQCKSTTLIAYITDVLLMQMLDNTHILNFFNILFGILPQNDGHPNELDLPWEGCILLIQLSENVITFDCFL